MKRELQAAEPGPSDPDGASDTDASRAPTDGAALGTATPEAATPEPVTPDAATPEATDVDNEPATAHLAADAGTDPEPIADLITSADVGATPTNGGTAAPAAGTVSGAQAWIPEVQGLRTLALLLVATFHIWFDRVSGGVDIFLVVSAYLMTRSLFGRLDRGAPLRAVGYIVKRFGRIVPLAGVVAALTFVGCLTLLPASRLGDFLEQFIASVTYTQNLWLQAAAVDYLADEATLASPFQQFWSLSIQGQIFVIWPLLLLLVLGIHKVTKAPLRPLALSVFGTILVAGFAWSVHLTAENQPYAYFDLGARVWEFAAGSVLALVAPWLRFGPRVRGVLSWLGIAGALTCGLVLPVGGTFPGVAALWPVLATALVIVGSGAPTRAGGDRLLAHPVMTRIGDYTYALYLIHWPLLVFTLAVLQTDRLDALEGTLVLLSSGVLSIIAVHLVEKPVAWFTSRPSRISFPWRPIIAIAVIPFVAFTVNEGTQPRIEAERTFAVNQLANAPLNVIGPNAPADVRLLPTDNVVPDPSIARDDLGWLQGCTEDMLPEGATIDALESCQVNSDVVDPADAERDVYLVGNSHAQQMTQLVDEVAAHANWSVRAYLRFGCQYNGAGHEDEGSIEICTKVWDDATYAILQNRPDAVVIMANRNNDGDIQEDAPGLEDWITRITDAGIQVVTVRDNPRSTMDLAVCGELHGFGAEQCSWRTTLTVPNEALRQRMEAAGAVYLDPNDLICPDGVCRAQIGGVVTYFDTNHVTATYMRALAYTVSPTLHESIPWWPDLVGVTSGH